MEGSMSQVRRRQFLIAAGALLAVPLRTDAQRQAKIFRIGMLIPVAPSGATSYIEAFRQGLRKLGYVEGQHVTIEPRYSEGRDERLRDLAAELVSLKVDVVVAWGTPAARAAKAATRTIPIVTAAVVDPVGTGLISSLARPGGNLTGVTSGGAALSGKSLELLTDLVPGVTRIAVFWNPSNPVLPVVFRETQLAAEKLNIRLQSVGVSDPNDFESAFAAITQERPGALLVLQDLVFQTHRKRIVELVAKTGLPAMYERKAWVDVGGLMSYGVSFPDNFRRAAAFVDKILKGAKPADLPVEDPTKFELIINLKTAKAIGLTVPQSVLLRADHVIR
jgi:putative ABC transport system substrate-binding protein